MDTFNENVGNYDLEFYSEAAAQGPKDYYFEGIVAQADVINGNRRIYPSEVLMPAVEMYNEVRVKRNLGLGELDHPDTLTVQSKEVSHRFTKMWIEGNNVMGKALILDTPNGKTVKNLIDGGVTLSVSSRGGGRSKRKKGIEYLEAYIMTAVDIVSFPSAPDSFPEVKRETLELLVESGYVSKTQADLLVKTNRFDKDAFRTEMSSVLRKALTSK